MLQPLTLSFLAKTMKLTLPYMKTINGKAKMIDQRLMIKAIVNGAEDERPTNFHAWGNLTIELAKLISGENPDVKAKVATNSYLSNIFYPDGNQVLDEITKEPIKMRQHSYTIVSYVVKKEEVQI